MSILRYAMDGCSIERDAFYRVACDPARSVAVEACAGSGKTWLLVSRMLRALLEPVLLGDAGGNQRPVMPHEILAITFTKKASGEMRRRLNQWLMEFVQTGDEKLIKQLQDRGIHPDLARPRLQAVRDACSRWLISARPVQVRTIHGWFASLLRGAPLSVLQALGIPFDYVHLEDDAEAVSMLWPRLHRVLLADANLRADFSSLIAEQGRHQVRSALEAALARRLEFELADAHGAVASSVRHFSRQFKDFTGLESPQDMLWLRQESRDLLELAAQTLGRASAPSYAAAGAALQAAVAANDLVAVLQALLTKDGAPRKFSEKMAGIAQIRTAQALLLRVREAGIQHQAWRYQQRMLRLTRAMVREFSALKRERGWVDMPDLERAALHLLSDPVISGWLQERLDLGLRHLLIDEFQDTSPLQWQALQAWLSAYAGAGDRVLRVFIVGDPKQSIYRFRGAEPRVFAAAQDFIRQGLGGVLLGCDHTRRNALAVVDAVNRVMGAAPALAYPGFRAHSTEVTARGAVGYLPLIERAPSIAKNAPDTPDLIWRDSLTTPRLLPEEALRLLECRQAAAWVSGRLAHGAAPGEIMILARKRDRLVLMEQELRALRIACEQPERAELGETCEVQDVLALIDALLSPQHDLSLARALKSPIFGASDEDLVRLELARRQCKEAAAPGARVVYWLELLCRADQTEPSFIAIGARLSRWQAWLARLPPHDALVAIYQDGDLLRRFAQASPAAQRSRVLSNLTALLSAALEMDGGRYATPYGLVRRMRRGGFKAATASAADAVRLLTIHGAKGLEANHVLILDTDASTAARARPGVLLDWPMAELAPLKFAFLMNETTPPACCERDYSLELKARQREELNALYVAMTRARCELVFSALQAPRASESSWWARLLALTGSGDTGDGLLPAMVAIPSAVASAADGAATERLSEKSEKSESSERSERSQTSEWFDLKQLPSVRGAVSLAAIAEATEPVAVDDSNSVQTHALRLGLAMHRLLEIWPNGADRPRSDMVDRVRREHELGDDDARRVTAMAQSIITGEAAWAWDPVIIDWSQNEVEILSDGERFRLDRLVHRRDPAQWWVLDYKSRGGSLELPERVAQLRGYRNAVQRSFPKEAVHAAFLAADGHVEICD